MNVLKQLFSKRKAESQKVGATWADLVRDVAGNDSIDVDQVDKRLQATGKSPESLRKAVEAFLRIESSRLTYKAGIEFEATMQANGVELARLRTAHARQVQKLQDQFAEATSKIRSESPALEAGIRAADEARRFLMTQPRPENVEAEMNELTRRKSELMEVIEDRKTQKALGNNSGRMLPKMLLELTKQIESAEAEIKEICEEEGRLEESCFA
jgi:hypothetical protein